MNHHRLSGLVAATHTPFTSDGSLDLASVEKLANHLLNNQVTCAFIAGTTGESHSLTLEERLQLTRRWLEVTRGTSLKVVVHVGSNCLADASALAAQAESLGALAVAALAPSYFKPRGLDELIAGCAAVAAAAPETPFYYYDIPAFTGVSFAMPEFLAQAAARIPTLAGIKYSNPDLTAMQLCLQLQGGAFNVLFGIDECLLAALALGVQGAVGSSYNFAAPIYHRLIKAFEDDDLLTARREQLRSVQVIQTIARYGYMAAAKAVMTMLGAEVGPARLPNANLSAEQRLQLRRDLEQLGFFDWIR